MNTVIWGQTMSDFTGSPADVPATQQKISVRQPRHTHKARIVLSNRFGAEPLRIEHARLSRPGASAGVTFGGAATCEIAPGQELVSDWIEFALEPGWTEVELVPAPGQRAVTLGSCTDRTVTEVTLPGCGPAAAGGVAAEGSQFYWGLQAFEAQDDESSAPIVCFFGDSLTNQGRYCGEAARRLEEAFPGIVTLNCGISGNRLVRAGSGESLWARSFGPAGVERIVNDVTFGGRTYPDVIFALLGVNDLYQATGIKRMGELPAPGEIEQGLSALQTAATRIESRLIVGMIPPFKGAISHEDPAWTPEKEHLRQEANAFIRSLPSKAWADVDAAVRDSDEPERLDAVCDCGDHLHFSPEGVRRAGIAVANAIASILSLPHENSKEYH